MKDAPSNNTFANTMPASQHDVFKQPPDLQIPVWRYMDFTKFVAMLETSSLYFSRADKLGDPFEGSYSRVNEKLRPLAFASALKGSGNPQGNVEKILAMKSEMVKSARFRTFINCWHMNDGESAAMWKLYANSNEAIAIRSTYSRLTEQLDSSTYPTYLGVVNYIDFERDWMPEGNLFYPFVHKQKSFEHEREVRAVILRFSDPIDSNVDPALVRPSVGIEQRVDLRKLIDSIYVAPTSPAWFRDLLKSVCHRYDFGVQIVQSALDAEPFY